MENGQLRRMLLFEGSYYATVTLVLILTIGSGIMVLIGKLTKQIVHYAVFTYPYAMLIIMAILIYAICLIVPGMVHHNISKESITDRLRNTD